MFTVSANFIRAFKVGDNINHNLAILRLLYALCNEDSTRWRLLRKPIIITLVSITEAMLYDFMGRLQSSEHVETLSPKTLLAINEKDYSNLTNLLGGAKKHDLFNADQGFYDKIDELRKLRNRVHIQNEKNHFEGDESKAFSLERQRSAEEVLEYICKFLASEHPRKTSTHGYVKDLEFPWAAHFK